MREADLVALHLPMHTATRLAAGLLPRLRALNPRAHLAAYGLYAPMNEGYLRRLGVRTVLGGEFEAGLLSLAERLAGGMDKGLSEGLASGGAEEGQPEPRISDGAAALPRARSVRPSRARSLREARAPGRNGAPGRLRGGEPRVQAPLPPLPGGAGLRRTVPRGARRCGDRGRRAAGGGRRASRHVRRSGFPERPEARLRDRPRARAPIFRRSPTTSRSRSRICSKRPRRPRS